MTYALVVGGIIQSTRNTPPPAARRLDTGAWVTPLDGIWTEALAAACGWLPVAVVARTADTATHTSDYAVTLVGGVPTDTWTVRAKTQAELDATTSTTNGAALLAKAATALTNNAAFLAVASPTNAQAVAQVKALTRQVNALIRLARRDLLSTDGT